MEAFELRLWDGRLGRWLTVDPMGQYFSPYLGMGNNPISRIDPDGGADGGPGDPPGFFQRIGSWFKSTFSGAKESGYQDLGKENDVAYTVALNDVVIQKNKETIPCNTCHHNSQLNPAILGFIRDVFFDRQSGYIQMDGEMSTNFTGGSTGKKGVIYNTVEFPWTPRPPTMHSVKFPKLLDDIKLFSDLFSTEMEMTGIMKNRNDKDVQIKTFFYDDTISVKLDRFRDFGGYGGVINGTKIIRKKGYMYINGKDTMRVK